MMQIYTILKNEVRVPMIAHIPHSSTFIPPDIRASLLLSDQELERQLLLLTDRHVDELFSSVNQAGGLIIRYNISRIVVDPERFEKDEEEVMSKKGMGVIYTKTSDGKDLRPDISVHDRENLLESFYYAYHQTIEEEIQALLDKYDSCLILDCHSFPATPLPFELDQDPERPDICIGIDDFHTPLHFIECLEGFFKNIHLKTNLNKPYAGTYVPLRYLEKDKRVSSIMIEVNRKLYMNESTGEKINSFPEMKNIFRDLISNLSLRIFSIET